MQARAQYALLAGMIIMRLVRLQQHGGHGRRQRQRHQQRHDRGRSDDDGELAIEDAGNAGHEHGRDEHRHQHQTDRDQGARDLLHGAIGGFLRRQTLPDIALDILDHDDGVIDHDPDRQHQGEQAQRVDRIAQHQLDGEGRHQRHRNGHDRDDRRPPGLQEHHDHQHHQQDGLDQGVLHRLDRGGDEFRRIIGDRNVHAGRQFGTDGLNLFHDPVRRAQRIGARLLDDGHADAALAVKEAADAVILGAQLHAGDIANAGHPALGIGLDDDVREFVRVGQAALDLHRQLEGRGIGVERRLADSPGGGLHVLGAQGGDDVRPGQAALGRLGRVDPDPHRIVAAAKDLDRADALDTQQPVAQRRVRIVADIVIIQ